MTTLHGFTVEAIDGKALSLGAFAGKAVLVVNVASRCGFTPQYAGLEKLYEELGPKGLVVLGVPANDFGAQEPGSNEEIKGFCESRYSVTFPMLAKIVVKGDHKHELYDWLTKNAVPGGEVQWNFEKFLLNKEGKIIGRFKSGVAPESVELRAAIANALAEG